MSVLGNISVGKVFARNENSEKSIQKSAFRLQAAITWLHSGFGVSWTQLDPFSSSRAVLIYG